MSVDLQEILPIDKARLEPYCLPPNCKASQVSVKKGDHFVLVFTETNFGRGIDNTTPTKPGTILTYVGPTEGIDSSGEFRGPDGVVSPRYWSRLIKLEVYHEVMMSPIKPSPKKENNMPKIFTTAVEFIKRMALSKEDKLMIDMGLEDPQGVPTQDGWEAMRQLLYTENRAKLVEVAQKMKAEAKEEKKCCEK